MLRRSGFAQKMIERQSSTALTLAQRAGLGLKPNGARTAVMALISAAPARAIAKEEPGRNRRLLDLAHGMPCLFQVPDICVGGIETTVACHQNEGKGMALKQSDARSAWGCVSCHRWYDQSGAPRTAKRAAFMLAHLRQVNEWREIAADSPYEADRRAAQWALDQLNASPVGLESPL